MTNRPAMTSPFRLVRALQNRWFGVTAKKGVWAILDQGVVSGARFVATAIIGRFGGPDELGMYAMGFSIVILVNVIQESLLFSPYAARGRLESETSRKRFAGGILVHHVAISLTTLLGCLVLAAILAAADVRQLATLFAVLAGVMPAVFLHEFARRISFAHSHVLVALLMDGTVAMVQLAALAYLAASERLSFTTALSVWGIACVLGGAVWLYCHRSMFHIRWRRVLPQLERNWAFGRWILGSQQIKALGTSANIWVLSAACGATATGVFAACSIVVTAVNPLMLGLFNVLEAKSAQAFAEAGKRELLRVTRKVTFILALALSPYLLAVAVAGESLVIWIFNDPIYSGQGHTLTILALATAVRCLRLGWNCAIRTIGLPEWNFVAGVAEFVVTIAFVAPLSLSYGVLGAAYGILLGSVAGSLTRWLAFHKLQVWREDALV
ncbi:hypothetical protein LOC68_01920 [Blastopirellula sp. JC732]|uniref:Uncharacterized protein n=1 Tax=Blastopirellula sediminis TaxID=2894196 RepID=A0A9X1MHE2_9BACT|nr:hypothetical protein [Blastopirellula sediminis]MCC9608054.1 hypothetical protein [Blastopirellula sediminis]MCC9627153.1 hypothetical protein [Blastopirellula sediminis]